MYLKKYVDSASLARF